MGDIRDPLGVILRVVGARPNYMKMAPLLRASPPTSMNRRLLRRDYFSGTFPPTERLSSLCSGNSTKE